MSTLKTNCPHCHQSIAYESDAAGVLVNCPACEKKFLPTRELDGQAPAARGRLITCPDCGMEISARAQTCIYCGCPMAPPVEPPPLPPSPQPAGKTGEETFFQSREITVTSARFIVGTKTFAMRTVTSVQSRKIPANNRTNGCLAFGGLVILIATLGSEDELIGIVGVLIMAGGIWAMIRNRPTYAVVLKTNDQDAIAYQSRNSALTSKIIHALNKSIGSQS